MSRLHDIQVLNDNARSTFVGCVLLMSREFFDFPVEFKDEALARIRAYRKFSDDGHHDAGLILLQGRAVKWRFEYRNGDAASPLTIRALIVEMLQ